MKTLIFIAWSSFCAALFSSETPANPNHFDLDQSGVQLSIEITKMPRFPLPLIDEGYTQGDVRIAMDIDHDGELRDWIAVEASHQLFIDAIERVIFEWRFSPPYIDGNNRSVVSHLNIHFNAGSSVISYSSASSLQALRLNQLTGYASHKTSVANPKDLDTRLVPIYQPSPMVPKDAIAQHSGTRAVFTFYVDEAGQVRVPALVATDGNPELGLMVAAQDALMQWRFEPPTKNRRPVKVRLTQAFVFGGN